MTIEMPSPENIYDDDKWIAGAGSGVTPKDIEPSQMPQLDELTGHTRLEEQRELVSLRSVNADLVREVETLKKSVKDLEMRDNKFPSLYSFQSPKTQSELVQHTLSLAERYGHKMAFMMFDLDRFRDLNETLSHTVADKVIQALADSLVESIRSSDLPFHMTAGDELAGLIIDGQDPETVAVEVLTRLVRSFEQKRAKIEELRGTEFERTGFSCGVVIVGEHEPAESFAKRADRAVYNAKRAGRNCISINDSYIIPLDSLLEQAVV